MKETFLNSPGTLRWRAYWTSSSLATADLNGRHYKRNKLISDPYTSIFVTAEPCSVRCGSNGKAAGLRWCCACSRQLKGLLCSYLENNQFSSWLREQKSVSVFHFVNSIYRTLNMFNTPSKKSFTLKWDGHLRLEEWENWCRDRKKKQKKLWFLHVSWQVSIWWPTRMWKFKNKYCESTILLCH